MYYVCRHLECQERIYFPLFNIIQALLLLFSIGGFCIIYPVALGCQFEARDRNVILLVELSSVLLLSSKFNPFTITEWKHVVVKRHETLEIHSPNACQENVPRSPAGNWKWRKPPWLYLPSSKRRSLIYFVLVSVLVVR